MKFQLVVALLNLRDLGDNVTVERKTFAKTDYHIGSIRAEKVLQKVKVECRSVSDFPLLFLIHSLELARIRKEAVLKQIKLRVGHVRAGFMRENLNEATNQI